MRPNFGVKCRHLPGFLKTFYEVYLKQITVEFSPILNLLTPLPPPLSLLLSLFNLIQI
jgi:hypothetical protein